MSVIDTVTLTTSATIPVGASPQESAVTPDGGRLFLVHESDAGVTVIDTATNLVIANVVIGGHLAKDVLFTLDGHFAYIANYSAGTVNVIDTATYRVKTISTGAGPSPCPFSRGRSRVCYQLPGQFRVRHRHPKTKVDHDNSCRSQAERNCHHPQWRRDLRNQREGWNCLRHQLRHLDCGQDNYSRSPPWHIIITSDGTKAFVSNSGSGTVSVIDTATRQVIQTLIPEQAPSFQ